MKIEIYQKPIINIKLKNKFKMVKINLRKFCLVVSVLLGGAEWQRIGAECQ